MDAYRKQADRPLPDDSASRSALPPSLFPPPSSAPRSTPEAELAAFEERVRWRYAGPRNALVIGVAFLVFVGFILFGLAEIVGTIVTPSAPR